MTEYEYTVKSPIKYAGRRREPGEPVEIKEARVAKELLASGAIAAVSRTELDEQERKRREEEEARNRRENEERQLLALLDRNVAEIVEVFRSRDGKGNPVLTVEHLKTLRQAEQKGKTRSSLIAAIDEEIAARQAPPA